MQGTFQMRKDYRHRQLGTCRLSELGLGFGDQQIHLSFLILNAMKKTICSNPQRKQQTREQSLGLLWTHSSEMFPLHSSQKHTSFENMCRLLWITAQPLGQTAGQGCGLPALGLNMFNLLKQIFLCLSVEKQGYYMDEMR